MNEISKQTEKHENTKCKIQLQQDDIKDLEFKSFDIGGNKLEKLILNLMLQITI